jgi:uroporphyrinogen-III decarboxylase
MNDKQWKILQDVIAGKAVKPLPVGFIIDSPWLPGWAGISTLDYFTSDSIWLQTNLKAIQTFPEAMFLPGFWSEYGMCTEPSAFGAGCTWRENELPYAEKTIRQIDDIDTLSVPDPRQHGLAPFVLNRLKLNRKAIEKAGHKIRFAVARGPLNIATFLMGTTEFLMALKTDPQKIHALLKIITEFTTQWLKVQKDAFDTIDGIFILDDIVGFLGEPDFKEFAQPYLKAMFGSFNASVRFFHNDADGRVCSPHLADTGINLFNFSFNHSLKEMKEWTGGKVALVGNIPPRDVLAQGTAQQITQSICEQMQQLDDQSRILFSCGGGIPQNVSTENINTFIKAVQTYK